MRSVQKNNVILISLDCVRLDSLGCYGSSEISTPSIDRLAAGSVRFTQAISHAPFTPASHASVFTGLNPNRHGIRYMIGQKLQPVPTMAEIFHSMGWSTAAFVGSSALSNEYGLDRGFNLYGDEFEKEETNWILGFRRDCEESTTRALEWMARQKRFLAFLHYFDAHAYDGEHVSIATQRRGLEAIDSQLNRLLAYLEDGGILDDTVIVVFSDHGDSISEHGENGHLEYLYDTTLRVPFILKLPGQSGGSVVEQQVRLIDVLPTLVDYFGIAPLLPKGIVFDGDSLLPVISGVGDHAAAFSETCMEAGQRKDKKTATRYFSIRTERTKIILEKLSGVYEAYDLVNDPGETTNIWDERGDSLNDLTKQLDAYIKQGEKLERVRMMSQEEGEVRRSLEALGYMESSAAEATGEMAFYS